jgi:hypothetical protein
MPLGTRDHAASTAAAWAGSDRLNLSCVIRDSGLHGFVGFLACLRGKHHHLFERLPHWQRVAAGTFEDAVDAHARGDSS